MAQHMVAMKAHMRQQLHSPLRTQVSPSQPSLIREGAKNFNIEGQKPLIETRLESLTKSLKRYIQPETKDESIEPKGRRTLKNNISFECQPTYWSNTNLTPSDQDSSGRNSPVKLVVAPPEIKYLIRKRELEADDKRPFKPFASFNKPVTFFELTRNSLS